MRKKLFLKLVLVAATLFTGANSAWATTIGADGKTTGYWTEGCNSEAYVIAPNQTRTFKFVNHSSKANAWNNWMTVLCSTDNFWDYNNHYIRMRADFYGWTESNGNTNENPAWMICNLQNSGVDWAKEESKSAFINNLDGATVYLTVKRLGSTVFIIENVKGTASEYNHYYAMTCGDGTQDIYAFLAVDCAQIVIDDAACTYTATETVSGTLIGSEDNTSGFFSAFSDYFTVEPNKSLTLKFKNYTNKINNYNNFVAFVTTDADRFAADYTEYMGLRADNWVNVADVNATSCNYGVIDWNWATFRDKLDGATVTLTVTRTGANVTVRADIEPADGSTTLYEEYTKACGDGTQNIRVFLTVEGAHLDLLPVSKTITTAGWATLCSEYALDLTGKIENLEAAYAITGNDGTKLTLTEISQVVAPGQGILLKGSGECRIPIKGSGSAVDGNKLVGVLSETAMAPSIYVLMDGGNGVGFYKTTKTFTVGANTAYLPADAVSARAFYSFDDATTGIGASLNDNGEMTNDKPVYNLAGQRVSQPTKGLYIIGGKKVALR